MGVNCFEDCYKWSMHTNRVLLGLLMLVAGLFKIAYITQTTGMLETLGFPFAVFFTWVLIVSEILSGLLILVNFKVNMVAYLPIVILIVAAFTAHFGNYMDMLIRLVLASNYLLLALKK